MTIELPPSIRVPVTTNQSGAQALANLKVRIDSWAQDSAKVDRPLGVTPGPTEKELYRAALLREFCKAHAPASLPLIQRRSVMEELQQLKDHGVPDLPDWS